MARYPTPPSGNLSGDDGHILRQGSAGRKSMAWFADDEEAGSEHRDNCQDFDSADFGGTCCEYGDA